MCHSSQVLIFGCCVGPSGKFATVAEPALAATMHPQDLLVLEQGSDGICVAYNRIIQRAKELTDCEGVVLVHDDTALGRLARDQIIAGLREPGVGVVGVVGGRGLFGPQWVNARRLAGYANDFYGWRRYGPRAADVDVVDGLVLALAPAAYRAVTFDEQAFPAFHGYDTDYCLQAREAGLRVRVVHVDYEHKDKGHTGDGDAFVAGELSLRERWPDLIRPLGPVERPWRALRDWSQEQSGSARHRTFKALKALRPRGCG